MTAPKGRPPVIVLDACVLYPLTDTKDRHVTAAALAARKRSGAEHATIVTWNLKHFDRKELATVGLVSESPDAFLCRLFAISPEQVAAAFFRMRDNLRNPPRQAESASKHLLRRA